jgi:hypothetical protein
MNRTNCLGAAKSQPSAVRWISPTTMAIALSIVGTLLAGPALSQTNEPESLISGELIPRLSDHDR